MDRSYIVINRLSRERLQKLAKEISHEQLMLKIYREGWTVAAALAHLAFWDQYRLLMVRQWNKTGVAAHTTIDVDLCNDALLPFFLALDPRAAANLSVSTAEELDRELEQYPQEMIESINRLGDRFALDRALHRNMHLDEIEALLAKEK